MKRTMLAFAACVVIYGSVQGTEKPSSPGDAIDFESMAEDIEIMQRIIDRTLREHFADAGRTAALLHALDLPGARVVPGNWKTAVRIKKKGGKDLDLRDLFTAPYYGLAYSQWQSFNVAGYYVPGTGAVFTLEFAAPTTEVTLTEEEAKADLWDRIEGEVRGRKTEAAPAPGGTTRKQTTVDHDALDRTVELLIKTVGEYGSRIGQLSDDDSIVLAAQVSAQGTWPSTGRLLFHTYTVLSTTQVSGAAVPPYRVIIRVPVAGIRDFETGQIDFDALRKRAEVVKYQAHGSGSSTVSVTVGGE